MSSKCPRCDKIVYFAERQTYDGKDYHGTCLIAVKKETKPKLIGKYPGDEHRIAGELKTSPKISNKNDFIKFCPNCGTKTTGGKFCSSCGTLLSN